MKMIDPELQQEATDVLWRLIQFNTVNPPGNERALQEYLCDYLTAAGLECELIGAEAGRPNLLARLRGERPGPTLAYLGHVDTVLADAGEWQHDPWSGELADGYLWGRGALDMKSQVAAEVVALAALARSGYRPAYGELLLMAIVDEETGGGLGAKWLCEQHPDRVRCDMLINEGAGAHFEYGGQRYYGVCTAEKGVARFTITTAGVAGHASIPRMGENALLKMAEILVRLRDRRPNFDLTPQAEALLSALGENGDGPEVALEHLAAEDPRFAMVVEPTLGVTFAPTRIRASEKINVIPSRTELKVDCRVPPGLGSDVVRGRIAEVLEGLEYELEFGEQIVGNGSPVETPLMDLIGQWISENDPTAKTAPTVLPGFTDSRWFRDAFPECVAYGFFPQREMSLHECAPLIHGADERIAVGDLAFAAKFFYDLPGRVLV